jgi:uncharacterized protein (DUF1697 family)
MLQRLGYTDVATLLNSGNAVFRAAGALAIQSPARHAAAIAAALADTFQLNVPVMVKTAEELAVAVAQNPLQVGADPSRLLVGFAATAQRLAGLASLDAVVRPPEQFVVGQSAAYLHCPSGILESAAGKALLARSGEGVTSRNWATVLKLQALVQATSAC